MTPLEVPTPKHGKSIINTAASHMTNIEAYFNVGRKYFTCDSHLKIIGGEFEEFNCADKRKKWIKVRILV
jgi:hypothetical protein